MDPIDKGGAKTIKEIIQQAENQIRMGNLRKGFLTLADICSKQPDCPEALGIKIKYGHMKPYQDALEFYNKYNKAS